MNALDIMKRPAAYVSGYENTPTEEQNRAKQLCWEYNRTAPNEQEKRRSILQTLLGTCSPMTGIQPDFHCDYGFNIHTHGLAVINYNCVILDTSPVNIGAGAFIAPGVCLACSGHAIDPEQRSHGIGTSAPITLNIINLRLDITHLYYPAKNSFQKSRLKRREIFTELLLYTLTT